MDHYNIRDHMNAASAATYSYSVEVGAGSVPLQEKCREAKGLTK